MLSAPVPSAGHDRSVRPLENVEREMIERALREFDGDAVKAAEALGLSRSAMYRRLDKHGLKGRTDNGD